MKKRRLTLSVKIGNLYIGSQYPVRIQSMTNTLTADIGATVKQIIELSDAGSELVRVTINDDESAKKFPKIKKELVKNNYNLPIIGDFHYNAHILLEKHPETAELLDKYRINPGNIGSKNKYDVNFQKIIKVAIKNNKPIRIGGNWGSINKDILNELIDDKLNNKNPISYSNIIQKALIKSVINSANLAVSMGLSEDKIIISCKTSVVNDLVQIYREISKKCSYPLHIGLTEAGIGDDAVVGSVSALSILLNDGIGDTIRVSLTPENANERTKEVKICQQILSNLDLRKFEPKVISCPGCGRTSNDYFISLSKSIKKHVDKKMPEWKKKHPGVESLKIAVMGCIVNGPGESKHSDIGISLPGNNEDPSAPVFIQGKKVTTLKGDNIENQFISILQDFIDRNYQ